MPQQPSGLELLFNLVVTILAAAGFVAICVILATKFVHSVLIEGRIKAVERERRCRDDLQKDNHIL